MLKKFDKYMEGDVEITKEFRKMSKRVGFHMYEIGNLKKDRRSGV